MKLRSRFALTTLLVAGPVLVLVVWLRTRAMQDATSGVVVRAVTTYMDHGGRAACERGPATWEQPPRTPIPLPVRRENADEHISFILPPPEEVLLGRFGTFAYNAQFHPANPAAPVIDPAQRAELDREPISIRRSSTEPPILDVLVRMPWRDGPCANILVRRPDFEVDDSLLALVPIRVWAPVLLCVFVGVVFGLGPSVRRIRQLTRDVRATARAGYDAQVAVRGRDEIADLAHAFNDAGREIRSRIEAQERRERTLREFLENTTHDVMTPLTVLQGHLAALADDADSDHAGRIRSAMGEAHYMASLIHNLALAAKLEAGEPTVIREPVDLDAVVDRVIARHLPIARNHAIALEHATPESPIIVRGDVTLVEQAISNVVLNAIQHGRTGGHVAVTLDRRDATQFALHIVDDGGGIPAADLARLVERGQRGNDARTRAAGGRGLGLDIAHRVAKLHAWMIVLSPTDGGLSVSITGPIAPA